MRVPEANRLPNVKGLKGPLGCLTQARYGITWGPIGAAIACFTEATEYAKERILFERPIAATQAVQLKLADMARRITLAQLLSLQLGRLKDAGKMQPTQVSLAKWNNVRMAIDIAREGTRHPRRRRHHDRALPDPPCAEPRIGDHVRGHRERASARGRPRSDRHQRVLTVAVIPAKAGIRFDFDTKQWIPASPG